MTLSSGQVLRPKLLVGADGVNSKVSSTYALILLQARVHPFPVPELPVHVSYTCNGLNLLPLCRALLM